MLSSAQLPEQITQMTEYLFFFSFFFPISNDGINRVSAIEIDLHSNQRREEKKNFENKQSI